MKSAPRPARRRAAPHGGLTVIELLLILAALAVVVLVSVPGASMLMEHYYLKSASGNLVSGLNLARSEAARRSSIVRMCPSSNGRFCRSDGDWAYGWLVYTDGNADGTVQDIELIQAFKAPGEKVRIVARGAVEHAASFTLSGLIADQEAPTGEFDVCLPGSDTGSRTIMIDSDGWVQLIPDDRNRCEAKS
ncbi:MAG: GspH/FimT family protein [Lysobacterales bacterium]